MLRILRSATLLVFASAALAAVGAPTVTLFTPDATVVRPTTGSVVYSFLGTITTDAGTTAKTQTVYVAGLTGSGPYLPSGFGGLGAQSSYTGTLFTVLVTSTSDLGVYALNPVGPGGHSAYFLSQTDGQSTVVPFSVTVVAVPEPATMAAFSLGAAAMLRRGKRASPNVARRRA